MTSFLRHVGIWQVFQWSSDFKILLLFSLHYQLFDTNQNTEKALSILVGLKDGCIREAEVKVKQCKNPLGAVYANQET